MHPTALLLGLSALLASLVLSAAAFVGTGECRVRAPPNIYLQRATDRANLKFLVVLNCRIIRSIAICTR